MSEVNFMKLKFSEEIERKHERSWVDFCYIEDMKKIISQQLEDGLTKLRLDRLALRQVVQAVLNMKQAGDGVANKVVATVAQIFADEDNPRLKRVREMELWFPKLKY